MTTATAFIGPRRHRRLFTTVARTGLRRQQEVTLETAAPFVVLVRPFAPVLPHEEEVAAAATAPSAPAATAQAPPPTMAAWEATVPPPLFRPPAPTAAVAALPAAASAAAAAVNILAMAMVRMHHHHPRTQPLAGHRWTSGRRAYFSSRLPVEK